MLDNERILAIDELKKEVLFLKNQGFRYVTMSCVDLGDSFDLIYHFDKEYHLENLRITIPHGLAVPSLSDVYFCAMLAENEVKDLFQIDFTDIALDCGGNLLLAEEVGKAPMCKQYVVKAKERD